MIFLEITGSLAGVGGRYHLVAKHAYLCFKLQDYSAQFVIAMDSSSSVSTSSWENETHASRVFFAYIIIFMCRKRATNNNRKASDKCKRNDKALERDSIIYELPSRISPIIST
jgi:hypothetical protein